MTNTGNCLPPWYCYHLRKYKNVSWLGQDREVPWGWEFSPSQRPPRGWDSGWELRALCCLPMPCPTPVAAAQDAQPALTFLPHGQKSDPSPILTECRWQPFLFFFFKLKTLCETFFQVSLQACSSCKTQNLSVKIEVKIDFLVLLLFCVFF